MTAATLAERHDAAPLCKWRVLAASEAARTKPVERQIVELELREDARRANVAVQVEFGENFALNISYPLRARSQSSFSTLTERFDISTRRLLPRFFRARLPLKDAICAARERRMQATPNARRID